MHIKTVTNIGYFTLAALVLGAEAFGYLGRTEQIILIVLIVMGIGLGYLHGKSVKVQITGQQISSFKHEAQNIILSLSRSDNNSSHLQLGQVLRFTESILLFQIEAKDHWNRKKYWEIQPIIAETLDSYKEYSDSVGVTIIERFAPTAPCEVNREALNIVLKILISNSIGVTPKGASVYLQGYTNNTKTHYEIILADGGGGVPDKVIRSFGKIIKFRNSIVDLHGQRRYGNGLNFLARLLPKTNIEVTLHKDRPYSAMIRIPLKVN